MIITIQQFGMERIPILHQMINSIEKSNQNTLYRLSNKIFWIFIRRLIYLFFLWLLLFWYWLSWIWIVVAMLIEIIERIIKLFGWLLYFLTWEKIIENILGIRINRFDWFFSWADHVLVLRNELNCAWILSLIKSPRWRYKS